MHSYLMLLITYIILATSSTAQELKLDATTYKQGSTITATWKLENPSPKDWIGIYPSTITPSKDVISPVWRYLGPENKSPLTLKQNLPSGNYSAYLFQDDGYNILAGPANFTVEAKPDSITLSKTIQQNQPINIQYSVEKPTPDDWIGIYKPEQTHSPTTPSLAWEYLNDTQTAGLAPPKGNITLQNTLQPGTYHTFLFRGNNYTILDGPHEITITPSTTPTAEETEDTEGKETEEEKTLSPWKLPDFNTRPANIGKPYKNNLSFYAEPQAFKGEFHFEKEAGPEWLKVSPTGQVTGTPTKNDLGTSIFTIGITDGKGKTHSAKITLKVNP